MLANIASSMSPTSANRPSTASAASSGTPRRRSAAASCARVRGANASSRRQICRATASGSADPASLPPAGVPAAGPSAKHASAPGSPSSRPSAPPASSKVPARRLRRPGRARDGSPDGQADIALVATAGNDLQPGHARATCGTRAPGSAPAAARTGPRGRSIRIEARADAELFLDLLLDLVGEVRVGAQEVPGVLLALAELVALVGVPGAGLADDRLLHAQVDQAALPADSNSVQNIEFGGFERRCHLIFNDLYLGPVTDRLGAIFKRFDPAHIKTHGSIEFKRFTARGGFGRPEHNADFLPQLINEYRRCFSLV